MSQDRKTIRNIDPEVLLEAKVFALRHDMTLGDLINQSLDFFMQEAEFIDEADMPFDEPAIAA